MTTPLYLLYLPLPTHRIAAFARRYAAQSPDRGYMVHAVLTAVFGDDAPKPFAIAGDTGERVSVYAYANRDLAALRAARDPLAPPDVDSLIDWNAAGDKPMPVLATGARLGFSVRVCPMLRLGRSPAGGKRPGAEVDAFLAALDKWEAQAESSSPAPDRESVYADWFRAAMERAGGTAIEHVRLAGVRRDRILRKAGQRGEENRPRAIRERPAAVFEGVLRVTDTDAVRALLARGLGRHRAFGFGMLMLRRAPC